MPFNHTFNSRDNLESILVCGTLEKAHRLLKLNPEPVQTPAPAQIKEIKCVCAKLQSVVLKGQLVSSDP